MFAQVSIMGNKPATVTEPPNNTVTETPETTTPETTTPKTTTPEKKPPGKDDNSKDDNVQEDVNAPEVKEEEESVIDTELDKLPKRAKRPKYYVIWSAPAHLDLVGVHHSLWDRLEQKLPTGRLCGSGCKDCKKFNTFAEAEEYFLAKRNSSDHMNVFWDSPPTPRQ